MTAIILHPDVLLLRERIEEHRRALADLFDERMELSFETLPRLRSAYSELFGELERKIQERTLAMSERRRMVELFSLKLDRGQKLDGKMVDLVLRAVHNEFARIRSRLERTSDRSRRGYHPRSGQSGEGFESPRERAEQTRLLYRRLAKRLHPDMGNARDSVNAKYWDLVQKGYLRGDLEMLRTVANLIDSIGGDRTGSFESLVNEERRMAAAVRNERTRLASIRSEEPFTIEAGLKDAAWIERRRGGLESELAKIDEEISKCDRFLTPVLAAVHKVNSPEAVQTIWSGFVESMYFNNR